MRTTCAWRTLPVRWDNPQEEGKLRFVAELVAGGEDADERHLGRAQHVRHGLALRAVTRAYHRDDVIRHDSILAGWARVCPRVQQTGRQERTSWKSNHCAVISELLL